ncbi:Protein of unknown function, partial [Gryllus bimaculatus]
MSLLLERTINGVGVRKQEAASAFAAVYATELGVDVTLHFLQEKYDETRNYLGSVNSIVSALSSRILYIDQRETLVKLIEDRWWDGLSSVGESALQTVDRNFDWLGDHAETIIAIVDEKTDPSPTTTPTTTTPTTTTPTTTTPPTTTPTTTTPTTTTPTTTTPPTTTPTTTTPTTTTPATTTTTPTTITTTSSPTTTAEQTTTTEEPSSTT